MFGRKPTIEHADFGTMTYARGEWMSAASVPTSAGAAIVSVDGDDRGPHSSAIDLARATIPRASEVVSDATRFVAAHEGAREFLDGQGPLTLDGFVFHANGEFAVGFGIAEWPDAMIDVKFRDGTPYDVSLGD